MGYIHRRLDGKYEAAVLYQDGYERCEFDTFEDAAKYYADSVRLQQGLKGPDYPVKLPTLVDETAWPVVTPHHDGSVSVQHDECRRAVRLAAHNMGRLKVGQAYEFRVSFVPVGAPAYVGEGI